MKKNIISIALFLTIALFSSAFADVNKVPVKVENNFLKGQWSNLVEESISWSEREPDNPLPHYFSMFGYYNLGLIDEANQEHVLVLQKDKKAGALFPEAERILNENQDSHYAFVMMGYAYYYRKEFDNALQVLRKAVELEPDYAQAYCDMATIYGETGDTEKSIEAVEKALAADPEYLPAYLYAGMQYLKADEKEKAEEIYKEAVKKEKKLKRTAYFHHHLALLYQTHENYQKAAEVLEEGIQINPGNFMMKLFLGDIYMQDDNFLEAEKVYKQADRLISEKSLHKKRVKEKIESAENKITEAEK